MIRALEETMPGRTTIAIAHRLSTIAPADKIIALRGTQSATDEQPRGTVADDGPHEQLIKTEGGVYKKLWDTFTKKDNTAIPRVPSGTSLQRIPSAGALTSFRSTLPTLDLTEEQEQSVSQTISKMQAKIAGLEAHVAELEHEKIEEIEAKTETHLESDRSLDLARSLSGTLRQSVQDKAQIHRTAQMVADSGGTPKSYLEATVRRG